MVGSHVEVGQDKGVVGYEKGECIYRISFAYVY